MYGGGASGIFSSPPPMRISNGIALSTAMSSGRGTARGSEVNNDLQIKRRNKVVISIAKEGRVCDGTDFLEFDFIVKSSYIIGIVRSILTMALKSAFVAYKNMGYMRTSIQ